MKRSLVFVLMAVLAICGCQVKEEGEFVPEGKTFMATLEALADDATDVDTKTSMDAGGNVIWKRGDQVSIFAGSTINEHYQVDDSYDGKTAAALNRVESPGSVTGSAIASNVAFYPYAATADIAMNSRSYVISGIALPHNQTYAEESFANGAFPMVAVTSSTRDYNLKFKNALGGLKLQLRGTAEIVSISITGNGNEILCGGAEVTVSNTTVPAIALTDESAKTVSLNCGAGVQLSSSEATSFIIALPPTMFSGGFTVTVTDKENKQMEIKTTKSQTITRSSLLKMPVVNYVGTTVAPQYVDLGLPSGLKWATCNLGAISPEQYGDYYAWGEVEPYYSSQNPLTWKDGKSAGYNWASYKWCNGSSSTLTKYNTDSSRGIVDNKTILEPEDDAAAVNWGGTWRMPTDEEWEELMDECTWTWMTQNGVNGRLVTGPNGNSIFLPTAGNRYSTSLYNIGSRGDFWSSSLSIDDPFDAWREGFNSSSIIGHSIYDGRCGGLSVRPVTDEGVRVGVTGISLNKSSITLYGGVTSSLTATVTPSSATQPAVIWSSSDTSVATVDYNGVVTGISVGTATITATTYDGGFSATCTITVLVAPMAVDLGLPSGLKWATCNLGATVPEEYGEYYAWGETEPYYNSKSPLTWKNGKTGYNWTSYQWCNGSNDKLNKYSTSSLSGTVDNKTVLELDDDAAHAALGGGWRMPTEAEWEELIDNCTWTWTEQNGVSGRIVTGPNGNSIFLPEAGGRSDADIFSAGSCGYYWSSSLCADSPGHAWRVAVSSSYLGKAQDDRYVGFSIRPVTDEGVRVSVTGVSLNRSSINLLEGNTASLTATVTPSNATQPNVIWSSSDNTVATVDHTGKVTAVSAGSTTITATMYDGGFTATCTITVRQGVVAGEDPFDVCSDLSVNGTANCYVVPKAGEFSFDASVMGNGPEGYIWEQTQGQDMHLWPYHREEVYFDTNDVLPSQAFVIWDDNEVITDVVYNAETKRISFTATGNKGNALIGLFDANATQATVNNSRALAYWSWHIWCTDSPKRFIQYDDKEDDYEILDRNLGATSANPADGEATYGFFYQFGRKDPLKGYDGIAGDQKKAQEQLKHSVNHPTYFYKLSTKTTEWFNDSKSALATVCADLWGNPAWQFCSTANIHPYQALRSELQKTIYDPCPPGYMVPPETCWTGIDEESIVILDNGVLIPTASGDSFYPFAGYISDLNSWENDSMGYYAYNGCTITQREKRTARVYSSYTGLHSEWDYEHAPNHYGGCSLSVHIDDGDPIDYDYLIFNPMYQSNRQRGHNVRCVKEFNN